MSAEASFEYTNNGDDSEYGFAVDFIDAVDTSHAVLLETCSAYYLNPTKKNFDLLTNTANTHSKIIHECMTFMRNTCETPEEYANAASNLIRQLDTNRVLSLNKATNSDSFTELGGEFYSAGEELSYDDETQAEFMEHLQAYFTGVAVKCISGDVNRLVSKAYESPAADKLKKRELLKKHSIDVGKIALGSAIGLTVARFLNKN